MFLWSWHNLVSELNPVANYLFCSVSFIIISMSFAAIGYVIHLLDAKSYFLSSDFEKMEKVKREIISRRINYDMYEEYENLLKISQTVSLDTPFMLKNLTKSDLKAISKNFSIPENLHKIKCATFADVHWVPIISRIVKKNERHKWRIDFYFATEEWSFYITHKNTNDDQEIETNFKELFNQVLESVHSMIQELQDDEIKTEKEYIENNLINLKDFVFFYFLNMVGINQSFIVPYSNPARIVHMFFGIYKFLVLGTFITLVIQTIHK
jgi:hypothetical protein